VDLAALRKNADVIAACVGPGVGVMAVVKADAYGHGAVACARALERKVWGFAVSLVEEGIELRRGGIEAPVIVLGSFYGYSHRDVVAYRLTPVIGDEADLDRFARAAEELDAARLGVHLKIDTGMSRLGLRPERLETFAAALARATRIEVTGLCSHLADADGPDARPTEEQLAVFESARAALERLGVRPQVVHVANSAGTVRFPHARFDLVRPGLALYGYSPSSGAAFAGLTPALAIKSRVVSLRELPAGATISYAGLYRTPEAARIATVPIGYADGYTRRLTGRAQVLVGGRRVPVVGAITMDMCMADVTAVPSVKLGDEVVLLGQQAGERLTADELAAWAGTIPWEIFCGISKRVPRVYLGDRA
jgi:alanine racemase